MKLKAGDITLQYENGMLRYLQTESGEVLRMIYFAVRDKNWGTVTPQISNEHIHSTPDSFALSYECLFEEGDIRMTWQVQIEGTNNSMVRFIITGKALSTFQKNRAGFCVLHPIEGCAGKTVTIQQTNGSSHNYFFPEYISPYQPFKDIAGMEWMPSPSCKAVLQFKGDVFETEDHRNWTDNNFKTYCTPLSIPNPVTMNTGDELRQEVVLTVEETGKSVFLKEDEVKITINKNERIRIPPVGIGMHGIQNSNYAAALKVLSGYGFHHCRMDIRLNDTKWPVVLAQGIAECSILKTKLEIALFTDDNTYDQIQLLADFITEKSIVSSLTVLSLNEKCINAKSLQDVLPLLRKNFPGIPIGAGTDIYFAELNRSSLPAEELDFVQYSVNPQVHAFDDASVVENAGAQGSTVISARKKLGKPVHLSPVTLKIRYNADATDPMKTGIPSPDPRQKTFFCAAWTVASFKYAIESGVGSLTYYETVGDRGIMSIENNKLQVFPVATVFQWLLQKKWIAAVKSSSSHPFKVSSLVVLSNKETCLLLANHSNEKQQVLVDCDNRNYEIQSLFDMDKQIIYNNTDSIIHYELDPEEIVCFSGTSSG
jgi:hypothetical protein